MHGNRQSVYALTVIHVLILKICLSLNVTTTTEDMTMKNESSIVYAEDVIPHPSRGRIVNGEATHISQTPWQVRIEPVGCGGSIISDQFVVSAAHCFEGHIVPYNVIIIYGTSYVIPHGTYPSVRATKILNHPWYRHYLSGYDISLIMLAHPIRLQPGVAVAIPLATRAPPDSRPCLISGFGRTSANGRQSNQLLSGRASIMNSDECARIWSKNQITPSLIRRGLIFCKDIPRGQPYAARTCMGDSGGPFACFYNGRYHLHGVVSFGDTDACELNAFTTVAPFISWIRKTANQMRMGYGYRQGK